MIQSNDPLNELFADKSPNRMKFPVAALVAMPDTAALAEPSTYTFICKPETSVAKEMRYVCHADADTEEVPIDEEPLSRLI
jgi:hypothetical protein